MRSSPGQRLREAQVRLFWSRDPESAKRTRAAELLYPWMVRLPGPDSGLRPQLLRPPPGPGRSSSLAPAKVGFNLGDQEYVVRSPAGRDRSRSRRGRRCENAAR